MSDGEFAFNALREGTEEGTPDSEQTLTMEPGEYIIHVEGHYEDYLTHLKFVTNKGQVFEIGTSSGNEFVFEIHNETEIYNLVGFDGSVSKYIDTLGAFYIIVNACDYSECSYEANRFNDTCDYELCYNEICGYDWNQCEFPECPCDLELLFNGKCDLDCNIEACNGYDSGDCKYPGCQECEENLLENGVCDMKCNTEKCNWDNEKCNKNCDCHPDLFENGECNFECYTEACEFDGGECELPDCKCDLELIYNDVCDY